MPDTNLSIDWKILICYSSFYTVWLSQLNQIEWSLTIERKLKNDDQPLVNLFRKFTQVQRELERWDVGWFSLEKVNSFH